MQCCAGLHCGRAFMAVTVFLSAVSDEFRSLRDRLERELTRQNVAVKTQEKFIDSGGDTLAKLDLYIRGHCDVVLHLVGDMTGAATDAEHEQAPLLRDNPRLAGAYAPLAEALRAGERLSYTQWEAWLALYRDKRLRIAEATPDA
jgi:hypothetical protein